MGAQTRQQCSLCQREEGPRWVVKDKITNLTSVERGQMSLASGESWKKYTWTDARSVELKHELQPIRQKKTKKTRQTKMQRTGFLHCSDMFISPGETC